MPTVRRSCCSAHAGAEGGRHRGWYLRSLLPRTGAEAAPHVCCMRRSRRRDPDGPLQAWVSAVSSHGRGRAGALVCGGVEVDLWVRARWLGCGRGPLVCEPGRGGGGVPVACSHGRCRRPVAKGRRWCAQCLSADRARNQRRRVAAGLAGVCVECRHGHAMSGVLTCRACRARAAGRERLRRLGPAGPDAAHGADA